jgi:hypothetical protein
MGMNPETNTMHGLTPEFLEKFPQAKDWTKFQEGETVQLKGCQFRVHEIGENRMVLKPIPK